MILYITSSSNLDTVQLWVNTATAVNCTCDFIKEQNEIGSLTRMCTFPMKTADCHLITSPLYVSLLIGTYHFIIGRSGEVSDEPMWNDITLPQSHTSNIDTALSFTLEMVFWPNSRLSHSHLMWEQSSEQQALKTLMCKSSRPAAFKILVVLFNVLLFFKLLAWEAFHHHYITWKQHSTLSQIQAGNIYQTLLLFSVSQLSKYIWVHWEC